MVLQTARKAFSSSIIVKHHQPSLTCLVQGDYIAIEDNLVHSNTWWGSSAESAIVIAEATHIDQEEGCGDTERWVPCVYKY